MNQKCTQETFTPPFCPNTNCFDHICEDYTYTQYVRNGWKYTQKPPGFNQKFKCTTCKKGFSYNTFSIDFRKKIINLGEEVLFSSMNGMSNSSIALKLQVSEATVRNRFKFIGRQSLLFEKYMHKDLVIRESVAYDGFESFTYDQYSPCYINTSVGSKSMYTYSTVFSPLNRKGRMTDNQKEKLKKLIKTHGRYPTTGISDSSEYVFKWLKSHTKGVLNLFSDEHQSYTRALKNISLENIEHTTINSKEARTATNKLFPINHLHRSYRHFFSSQQREAIAFQKNEAGMMDKIQIMKIYKNFMRTKFSRCSNYDPKAGTDSPAMYVNLADHVLSFNEIFKRRRMVSHHKLDHEELNFYNRIYDYSRRVIDQM
jgi:transposase-like protein